MRRDLQKRLALLMAAVCLIIFGCGSAHKAVTPTSHKTGVVLVNAAESDGPSQSPDVQNNSEFESNTLNAEASLPLSEEQIRSAKMDLEAFRLFCVHFKMQADQKTLNSIKKPTMEYIQKHIDPILNRRHQLQDDDYSRSMITIYYLKAYLYWIFDDVQAAREMVTQIKANLPAAVRAKTIYHFDQGDVAVEDALNELETQLANRLENTNGQKTD